MKPLRRAINQLLKPILSPYVVNRTRLTPVSKLDDRDVFIVSYPKSGNTWFQYLTAGIVFGVDPFLAPDKLVQQLVPDIHYNRYYKRYQTPMFYKSHSLPTPQYKRVVYLLRDGRDVMVSYERFLRAKGHTFDFAEFVDNPKVANEQIEWGRWVDHVQGWQSNPYGAEMITIRYEDLKQDAVKELSRFCEFLDIRRDLSHLEQVVASADFDKMQRKEKSSNHEWENDALQTEKSFVRRGKVGSFHDEMPQNVLDKFMASASPTLISCGYEEPP